MPEKKRRFYLWSVLTNRCPRCREGKLFVNDNAYKKNSTKMHEHCPVCGQPTEIEVGFYYGTGYVSYALSIALLAVTFVAWKTIFGLSFDKHDDSIFWWMGVSFTLLFALQPLLMRLSRTLWLSWFVSYDPNWRDHPIERQERVVKEQMHNW
jgi:uncharacterized protein (DUF983 family)